jgi:hypothetical protein
MTLPKLDEVDLTRAFTPAEQAQVNQLSRNERLQYMERHNSAKTMSDEERAKHYVSANYPEVKYGPSWTLSPPRSSKK